MNWPGLLKWSIELQNYEKSEVKPMDEETKKWLGEALNSYTVDDIKIMKEIIEILKQEETNDKEDEEFRLTQLEDLQDILEEIDKAKVLINLKGLEVILQILLNSKYESNRITANMIFAGCNQNNAQVQEYSISIGALKIINYFLNEKNIKIKEFLFSSLSSLVRGENLEAKRIFIQVEGLPLIQQILLEKDKEQYSDKLKQKALLLLKDLIYYDSKLHQTYNNIEPFANTNCKQQIYVQKPNSVALDEESKKTFNNYKEENQKYKDYVKNFLLKNNYWFLFEELLSNKTQYFIEGRESIFHILTEIIHFSKQPISENQKKFLSNHLEDLKKHKDKEMYDLYENEIMLLQEILK